MNSKKDLKISLVALAIVGIMIASGLTFLAPTHQEAQRASTLVSGTGTITLGNRSGVDVRVRLAMSTETTVLNDAKFRGPCDAMWRTPNGDLLLIDRNATSHVGAGDYGVLNLYRSTDNGTTWYPQDIEAPGDHEVAFTNLDVRNYAAGVDRSGESWIFFSTFDTDNYTSGGGMNLFKMYSMHAGNNGQVGEWWPPSLRAVNTTPYGRMIWTNGVRVGFAAYANNNSEPSGNYYRAEWWYSDVPTSYWSHTGITDYGPISPGPSQPSESSVVWLGGDNLFAVTRMDGSVHQYISHSTDNGVVWNLDGDHDFGLPYTKPPMLVTQTDDTGGLWVLALFNYNQFYFSFAYVPNLIADPLNAWSTAQVLAPGSALGIYVAPVWNATTKTWYCLTWTNTLTSDIMKFDVEMNVFAEYSPYVHTGRNVIHSDGNSYDWTYNSTAAQFTVEANKNFVVNLTRWDPNATVAANWTANGTSGTVVTFNLSGLQSNTLYEVLVDSFSLGLVNSDDNGNISFSYSRNWPGEHNFTVQVSYLQSTFGILWPLVSIAIIFMVLSAVMGVVIGSGPKGGKGSRKK